MFKLICAVSVLCTLSIGCVTARVRQEAALTLDCDRNISVREDEGHKSWIVEGCGRIAVCKLPPGVKDADVQCAGGGSNTVAMTRQ